MTFKELKSVNQMKRAAVNEHAAANKHAAINERAPVNKHGAVNERAQRW